MSTSRLALTQILDAAGVDPTALRQAINDHAAKLDSAGIFGHGTLASRPPAGISDRFYYVEGDSTAANNGVLWRDSGTSWAQVNPQPSADAVAATASLRTLGAGARQAAAGDHNHDGVYQPLAAVVSALPSDPVDGEEIYFLASAANGVVWHLRYRAGSASPFKWEFIGGSSLWDKVPGAATTNSNTYADLAGSVGPSITLPLAGEFEFNFVYQGSLNSSPNHMVATLKLGSAAASDAESAVIAAPYVSAPGTSGRRGRRTAAAGDVWKTQYMTSGGTGTFQRRELLVRPVRVG